MLFYSSGMKHRELDIEMEIFHSSFFFREQFREILSNRAKKKNSLRNLLKRELDEIVHFKRICQQVT